MLRRSMVSCALILSLNCGGKAIDQVDVRLEATSSQKVSGLPVLADEQGQPFTLERIEAYVRHVEFYLPEDTSCADFPEGTFEEPTRCDEEKIIVEGPFRIDLISGQATPSLEDLTVPAGSYSRVDVRFDDADTDEGLVSSEEELADNTMVATGTFELDGTTTPFDLVLKFNEDARFEADGGVEVSSGSAALLLLNAGEWFQALPISQCIADGDLEVAEDGVHISDADGDCSDIENTLKDVIKKSGDLSSEDDDDDDDNAF